MKRDGLDFQSAVESLKQRLSTNSAPTLPSLDCKDHELMEWVLNHYQASLEANVKACQYLEKRGLNDPELVRRFRLGFADRSLGKLIPAKAYKTGRVLRTRLTQLGILREKSGHEHLRGSLVIPVFKASGEVGELYGRKITQSLRAGTPNHLYLKGEHRGVFNREGMQVSEDLILCESLIDALTFWRHGYHNVTAIFGTSGLTNEIALAIRSHKNIKRLLIAYDRDIAGDKAARKHSEQFAKFGLQCFRIQFPVDQDANHFATHSDNPQKDLGDLIRRAVWTDKKNNKIAVTPPETKTPERQEQSKSISSLAENPPETRQEPDTKPTKTETSLRIDGQSIFVTFGERRYEVRGLEKNQSFDRLKVTIRVRHKDNFHMDAIDLYLYKQRKAFEIMASQELGLEQLILKKDLGKILFQLEDLQKQRLDEANQKQQKAIELSDAERQEALKLLNSPKLMQQILDDFEASGIVGEESNKLVGYLACTSRKLDKPLAVLIQSSSAAGKSSLLESILAFMPPEEVEKFSAMTGQSLYYMGDSDLQHKILAVIEEEGAEKAS